MTRLLTKVARTGLRRGIRDRSRGWLIVAASATALRLLQAILRERDARATLTLKTGDAVEIRELPPPTR